MKILVSKLSENYLETNNVSIITPRNDDVNIESSKYKNDDKTLFRKSAFKNRLF